MKDSGDVIEKARRLLEDLHPPGDTRERLTARRARRHRRRRIVSGVVGIVLGAGALFGTSRWLANVSGPAIRPGGPPEQEDTGARHGAEVVVGTRIDDWAFRVVRYRDDQGLYCQDLDVEAHGQELGGAGACDSEPPQAPAQTLIVTLGSASDAESHRSDPEAFTYIYGSVAERVSMVEIEWSDGETSRVEPTRTMYLAARRDAHPNLVRALDQDGTILASLPVTQAHCTQSLGSIGYCIDNLGGLRPLDERRGHPHCGWEDIIAVELDGAWYYRDPANKLGSHLRERFDGDATLPGDARPTGHRTSTGEAWVSPSEGGAALYVFVSTTDVERWPRGEPSVLGCD